MNRFFHRFVFVSGAILFATVVLGFLAGEFGWMGVRATDGQDGAYKQINVFEDVLQRIQSDYVTEPNMKNVNAGALHGLLESLDPDSSYLSPTEYKIYKDRIADGPSSVGLVVAKRFGYAVVVTVEPGSEAEKQKITDGDIIESIDGQSTRDLSVAMIHALLAGKVGSTVTISVVRSQKPEGDKITLPRTAVTEPTLTEQSIADVNAYYIKPGELTAARVNEVTEKIKSEAKGRKVILDLRDTATGEELDGVHLANIFLKQGTILSVSGQRYTGDAYSAEPGKTVTDAPVIVLVNHGTYGAAEVAAAAIADLKRGDVVGEHTFGEGVVQKKFEMADGGALFLTIAKYVEPSGKKFIDDGVTPTLAVGQNDDGAATEEKSEKKSDEILAKAVELLKSRAAGASAPAVKN